MGASPKWKVYREDNEYVASCHYPQDAAALVGNWGPGATIRLGHTKRNVVWTEGAEEIPAHESFDRVADIVWERERYLQNARSSATRRHD